MLLAKKSMFTPSPNYLTIFHLLQLVLDFMQIISLRRIIYLCFPFYRYFNHNYNVIITCWTFIGLHHHHVSVHMEWCCIVTYRAQMWKLCRIPILNKNNLYTTNTLRGGMDNDGLMYYLESFTQGYRKQSMYFSLIIIYHL